MTDGDYQLGQPATGHAAMERVRLIGNLNPASRPAQQLMELLWSEEEGEFRSGQIYAFTSRLLTLGYVVRNSDTLTVGLTDQGRGVARTLSQSTEGQLYKERHDQP